MPLISICICTYKRVELLAVLIESLLKQTIDVSYEIIVVDNDPEKSAKSIVSGFSSVMTNISVRYGTENRSGVSFVRNKLINLSRGKYIAFIDDDECATSGWLAGLFSTLKGTGADVVFGPVVSQYPEGSKQWLIDSGCFDRNRFETGSSVPVNEARTGNVMLLKADATQRGKEVFNKNFAKSGGEDFEFFSWLFSREKKFVWCNEAIVYETVPLSRQRLGFLMKRNFRSAVNYRRITSSFQSCSPPFLKRVLIFILSLCLIIFGSVLMFFNKKYALKMLFKGARGFGQFCGNSKVQFNEYGKETS